MVLTQLTRLGGPSKVTDPETWAPGSHGSAAAKQKIVILLLT